jgi:DNA repair protein RadC
MRAAFPALGMPTSTSAETLLEDPPGAPSLSRLVAKFEWQGPAALGDEELLAILFCQQKSGELPLSRARRLLHQEGGLLGISRTSYPELTRRLGLAELPGLRLAAALELHRRVSTLSGSRLRGAPLHPGAVAAWGTRQLAALTHEEVWALVVDARSCLMMPLFLAKGGAHGCALLPKDILGPVVRAAGAGFVLVHNHPSGDPSPSFEDLELTEQLARGAESVGCPLLDHVIIAGSTSRSLRESGHF